MEDVVALIEDVIAHLGDNLVRGGENGGSQGSAADFWSCGSNPPTLQYAANCHFLNNCHFQRHYAMR
jgi:hypothetical protein